MERRPRVSSMSPYTDLTCTLQFPAPGQHGPTIRLSDASGNTIATVPTSEADPHLPIPDQSVQSISALDILEHVHDEQTWLAEFARILVQGGELSVRAPLENRLAWIDALNIYRYVSDTTGRGSHLKETFPNGWHRHYAPHDLPAILELAGFDVVETWGEGLPVGEMPYLVGLLVGDMVLERKDTERRLFKVRSRSSGGRRLRLPAAIAARLMVRTRVSRSGFDPDPDLDASDRPEEQTATPLE